MSAKRSGTPAPEEPITEPDDEPQEAHATGGTYRVPSSLAPYYHWEEFAACASAEIAGQWDVRCWRRDRPWH